MKRLPLAFSVLVVLALAASGALAAPITRPLSILVDSRSNPGWSVHSFNLGFDPNNFFSPATCGLDDIVFYEWEYVVFDLGADYSLTWIGAISGGSPLPGVIAVYGVPDGLDPDVGAGNWSILNTMLADDSCNNYGFAVSGNFRYIIVQAADADGFVLHSLRVDANFPTPTLTPTPTDPPGPTATPTETPTATPTPTATTVFFPYVLANANGNPKPHPNGHLRNRNGWQRRNGPTVQLLDSGRTVEFSGVGCVGGAVCGPLD